MLDYSPTKNELLELLPYLTKRERAELDRLLQTVKTPLSPVAFARDVLGAEPTFYQEDIFNALVEHKRVAVRGPHGLGKTALASWVVLWGLCELGDDVKIVTTASAWRQLSKYLWPEIGKWARKGKWAGRDMPEVQMLNARRGGVEAFAVASDNPALIEGAHAKKLIYILDEAKAIPNETWDAVEGAFSSGDCYALAISTPGQRSGRFYDIHRHAPGLENWYTRHVTVEEAIKAGRVSREWVESMRKLWGDDSPVFQARVEGEFPKQNDNALISLTWIEQAREREIEPKGKPHLGCDIARFGDDDSCLFDVQKPCVIYGETWHGNDTMQSAGRIKARMQEREASANIDVIGLGAGVVDKLHEEGMNAGGVNVAEGAIDDEHYENIRAEMYWLLRNDFKDGKVDLSRLPKDLYDRLCGELTSFEYMYTSKGKIKLEPKELTKSRLGFSPDVADALALAWYPHVDWLVWGLD